MRLDTRPREDEIQVSALSPRAPRIWRLWTQDMRVLVAFVTLLVAVASVVVGVTLRASPIPPQPPTCSGALTASILTEFPGIGMRFSPTDDVVLVNEQSALSAVYKVMSPRLLADATCRVARVLRAQLMTDPSLKRGEDVWAIAYHVPGSRNSTSTFSGFSIDIWTFVDATSGVYVSAASALTP